MYKPKYPQDFSPSDDYSSLALPLFFDDETLANGKPLHELAPVGCGLVIDPKFGDDAQYKMGGGRGEPGETPQETAQRELEEEMGIKQPSERFECVPNACEWIQPRERSKSAFWVLTYVVGVPLSEARSITDEVKGNEGEIGFYFDREDFWSMVQCGRLLHLHYLHFQRGGIIVPAEKKLIYPKLAA